MCRTAFLYDTVDLPPTTLKKLFRPFEARIKRGALLAARPDLVNAFPTRPPPRSKGARILICHPALICPAIFTASSIASGIL